MLDAAQRETGLSRAEGARPARRLPLLRRRRREAAQRHLRRRAAAALAGDPGRLRRQRPDPRRAHQPPRHREPRGARGRADRVRGRGGPVSHDRALLEAVGSRTLVCEDGELSSHASGWAEYQRAPRRARVGGRSRGGEAASATAKRRQVQRHQAGRRRRRARRRSWSERIERAEAELREVEEELADPAAWSTPAGSSGPKSATRRRSARSTSSTSEWEEARTPSAELRPQRRDRSLTTRCPCRGPG